MSAHASGAKVLGFTMDAPAPDGAELVAEGGGYQLHEVKHRLCDRLWAFSDKFGVFVVACSPSRGTDWNALLFGKYGVPVLVLQEPSGTFWAADGFSFIGVVGGDATWFAPRTAPQLDVSSDRGDVHAAVSSALGKMKGALTSIFRAAFRAANAAVIADEDF